MPFSFGTKLMLTLGNYELPERILCDLVLEKGMKVIEMGTSIGILSAIIEKITNRKFIHFMQNEIFDKLKMFDTIYETNKNIICT